MDTTQADDDCEVRAFHDEDESSKHAALDRFLYPTMPATMQEGHHAIDLQGNDRTDMLSASTDDILLNSSGISDSTNAHNEPRTEYVPQFHFSGSKAGMEKVDKARIERIVAEVSKGNPYYEHAAQTDKKVLEKAKQLREKCQSLTAREMSIAEIEVTKRVRVLEESARKLLHRTIVCVDMDQFFVAVECRDNPKLKGLPLGVGPTLISTASYEARAFGVRSAMPTFIARKLCPQLVVIPGRYEAYGEASKRAQSVFHEYDKNFSMMSLDEAFLDLTEKMGGLTLETPEGVAKAEAFVKQIREGVCKETGGLTCSAGIASTTMLAKICSEKNKPNGQFCLRSQYEEMLEFTRALPVRKIPGIGKASELSLNAAFDIKSVNDLWLKRKELSRCLTPALVDFYLRVPLCATEHDLDDPASAKKKQTQMSSFFGFVGQNKLDDDGAEGDELGRKSISIERTFRAIKEERDLLDKLRVLSESLAEEMAEKNLCAKTFTLKLKTDTFHVRSRGESVRVALGGRDDPQSGAKLFAFLEPLLRQEMPICIRLMGVRASNLSSPNSGSATAHGDGVKRQPVIDRFLGSSKTSASGAATNSEAQAPQAVECPICLRNLASLKCHSNDEINAHIDSCLNRSTVASLVAESSTLAASVDASNHAKKKAKVAAVAPIKSYFDTRAKD